MGETAGLVSGGARLPDRVAATALVLERTTARAGGVASDGGGLGRFRWDDLGQAEILVDSFDSRLEEDRGALGFDEFGDLDGRFEADRGGGLVVAEDLSKSVDGEVGQVAEFVHNAVGALLAQGEEGTGEIGEGTGPEVALSWSSKGVRWTPASRAAAEMERPATRLCNTWI